MWNEIYDVNFVFSNIDIDFVFSKNFDNELFDRIFFFDSDVSNMNDTIKRFLIKLFFQINFFRMWRMHFDESFCFCRKIKIMKWIFENDNVLFEAINIVFVHWRFQIMMNHDNLKLNDFSEIDKNRIYRF